ncbi:SAM-dependent methyltransferase [Pseudofrankia asymbiotica]|uniref:SAM-dependent methyltransferase n=1 Tax=Pseudofrankia asymbiotica TaxID=1834516 RepID=UPI000978BCE4
MIPLPAPTPPDPAVHRPDLHLDRPHSARMYGYYADGKNNYPVDREAAERALSAFPNLLGSRAAVRSIPGVVFSSAHSE